MDQLNDLDKAFEDKMRVGIMSVLSVNDKMSHSELRQMLSLTDGNLASHISTLEKRGFVSINKQFLGKKPNTTYAATTSGKAAFVAHLDALEKILNNIK